MEKLNRHYNFAMNVNLNGKQKKPSMSSKNQFTDEKELNRNKYSGHE